MSAIKFNGVHKVPGRPTLVGGAEGRKYVANKILNNIGSANSRPYNSYQQSEFQNSSYMLIDAEYGVDDAGFTHECLTEQASEENAQEQQGQPEEPKRGFEEGFSIDSLRRLAAEQETFAQQYNAEATIMNASRQPAEDSFDDDYYEEETIEQEFDDDWCDEDDEETEVDFAPVQLELTEDDFSNDASKKTGILRLPATGVVRSSRGTVELLVHANGRKFKPHYNKCGMLLGVTISDGYQLLRSQRNHALWFLKDANGKDIEAETIQTVAFDKKGNLWYQTSSRKRVTFYVDGTTQTRVAS